MDRKGGMDWKGEVIGGMADSSFFSILVLQFEGVESTHEEHTGFSSIIYVATGERGLNTARVQHDSQGGSHSSRGQILAETSTHRARSAVRSLNHSPNNSISALVGLVEGLGVLCSVHKRYSLAHVEISILTALHSLQLQNRMVAVLFGQ